MKSPRRITEESLAQLARFIAIGTNPQVFRAAVDYGYLNYKAPAVQINASQDLIITESVLHLLLVTTTQIRVCLYGLKKIIDLFEIQSRIHRELKILK